MEATVLYDTYKGLQASSLLSGTHVVKWKPQFYVITKEHTSAMLSREREICVVLVKFYESSAQE